MEYKKPIVMKVKLKISNNPIGIVPGTLLNILIEIIDEYESVRTDSAAFTKDLVKMENIKPTAPGTHAVYDERRQRAIIKFPGMSQAEIAKIVGEDLKKLGVK